jgi:cyanophycinase-like exopeptidase
VICLQGGNEFHPACREMDALLLDAAGNGPVVIVPLAGASGRENDTAGANGVRHFRSLGATDVTAAPRDAVAQAIADAALVFLPGGSPRRLREALLGTPAHDALRDAARDRVVSGSSAGAMLLCAVTVLPGRAPTTASGLGIVEDFAVVPHYDGPRTRWENALRKAAPDTDILGIPECSGVLLDGEDVTAVGDRPTTLITRDERVELRLD